ncbi:RHS repeat-associated core domain-containing protein [Paenibacillus cymbidii]|uniref:RHS repeat-associated core domain-containing protein n=1 Tax=Paenibacillus cymbidii TaxID=1639034 RepID=UPI001081714D|nr:RHS repeat-associated core domain-containing protein [Paenibacillus cymbidii]
MEGYYFFNGHGDVVKITDKNGNILNTYEYDIWGKVISESEVMENPYKYACEVQDNESSYIYLRARYYDPDTGRFISEDTYEGKIENPLSLNLYTYGYNNPLRYFDPTGKDAAHAEWDANQYTYLYDLAHNSPSDGIRAWAQAELDANNVYIDPTEPNKVYANDEVWAAKNPAPSATTSSPTTSNSPTSSSPTSGTESGFIEGVPANDQRPYSSAGCAVSSFVMVADYYGANTDFYTVSKDFAGGGVSMNFQPAAVSIGMDYTRHDISNTYTVQNLYADVRTNVDEKHPAIIGTNGYDSRGNPSTHFVVAIGYKDGGKTDSDIIVLDPWGGVQTTLDKTQIYQNNGSILSIRIFTPN